MKEKILVVDGLKKHFPVRGGLFSKPLEYVQAVEGVSFHIHRGETLGLVGESGCGKTTLGRCILRLIEPTCGKVFFNGKPLLTLSRSEMKKLRREMQIIFQDPYGSLNPRMTVGSIVREGMRVHRIGTKAVQRQKVAELLEKVGLSPKHANRFPHEFSGGQRQRVGIARALAVSPSFIVCDEPVSALDVSVRAQIINLLQELQEELHLSYLFISHDLSVVKYISSRVAVMYLGKIVEMGTRGDLFEKSLHPYTKALLETVPTVHPVKNVPPLANVHFVKNVPLRGDIPSPIHPPPGCPFHPRCPSAFEPCSMKEPQEREVSRGHFVACHLHS